MKRIFHPQWWIFIILIIYSCQTSPYNHHESGSNILLDSIITADSLMLASIAPYKEKIDGEMNTVIGISEQELLSYFPESPLSNFVADIVQKKASNYLKENNIYNLPLFTLINIKGLRAPLPKGNVTTRDVFQLMPFENEILILKLSGKNIKELFEYLIITNGEGISGAKVVYADSKIKELSIDSTAFDMDKEYYLATSDYVASGGDNFTMVTHPINTQSIGCRVRETITEHIIMLNQNSQTIVSKIDGRIIFE